jgi:hypothetical protein
LTGFDWFLTGFGWFWLGKATGTAIEATRMEQLK